MAQGEFYFSNGISWMAENLYCDPNFMVLLQFVMRRERLFFREDYL